jgi:hypothetical protein
MTGLGRYVCMSCGGRFDTSEARGLKCQECRERSEQSRQRDVEHARRRADAVELGRANLRSWLLKGKRR